MGRGLAAALPAPASLTLAPGVSAFYWATDTSTLYAMNAAGTAWQTIGAGVDYFVGAQVLAPPTVANLTLVQAANFSGTGTITAPNANCVSLFGTCTGLVLACGERLIAGGAGTAGDFTVTGLIRATIRSGANFIDGIYLKDGAGKVQVFGYRNTEMSRATFTDVNTFSAIVNMGGSELLMSVPNWYRLRKTGATLYFEHSADGLNWDTSYSEAATTFLAGTITKFGICIGPSGASRRITCHSLVGA